jgi:2-polyprenyl-3-methyl-5-hydroxy-6-metoxy-1,4-benzoquinol methylase
MNYREQEKYLQGSRIWGGIVCLAFLVAVVVVRFTFNGRWNDGESIVFALAAVAVAVLMYYTPDYLHLSVNPERKRSWQIKFRWRAIAAVLTLGLLLSSGNAGRLFTIFAVAVLAGVNWLARRLPLRAVSTVYWVADLALISFAAIKFVLSQASPNAASAAILLILLAAAEHLTMVTTQDQKPWYVYIGGAMVVAVAAGAFQHNTFKAGMLLLAVVLVGTPWLVDRARERNARNIGAAMEELIEFTGYSPELIWELWATSNQQLAANWQAAKPSEDNPEQMAEWYRQNSELYLFAISGYNLEYKRIRSNMKVLRLAKGATLDYGAGNGEILLELARRGHRTAYYDVEGVTMRFARHRAERQGLAIDFFTTKEALAASARQRGFDTVFSFDVLEHLPDLRGELSFLSSLLAPGGVFVFDVPAGSTRAHPMHLNHNLNVLDYMKSKGLKDERGILLRLPFRKEEKFVFRKAAVSAQQSAVS